VALAHEAILAGLEARSTTDEVPPEQHALYRPSVQPYLISWLRQRPLDAVATLPVPLLVVHGAVGAQVDVEDGQLLVAARPGARLAIIDGMAMCSSMSTVARCGETKVPTQTAIHLYGFSSVLMPLSRTAKQRLRVGLAQGRSQPLETRRSVRRGPDRVRRPATRDRDGHAVRWAGKALILLRACRRRGADGQVHLARRNGPHHRRRLLAQGQGDL
jgi:hypothetical protein